MSTGGHQRTWCPQVQLQGCRCRPRVGHEGVLGPHSKLPEGQGCVLGPWASQLQDVSRQAGHPGAPLASNGVGLPGWVAVCFKGSRDPLGCKGHGFPQRQDPGPTQHLCCKVSWAFSSPQLLGLWGCGREVGADEGMGGRGENFGGIVLGS